MEISNQTLHTLLLNIKEDIIEIKTDVKTQNGRVRKLEIWRGFMVGGMAVLSYLLFK